MDQEAYFFDLEDENENSIGKCKQNDSKDYLDLQNELAAGDYVELPCYPNKLNFDWDTIVSQLSKDIHCIDDLIEAMQTYNVGLRNKNFDNLYLLCQEGLTADECIELFDQLLPKIIKLAFKLPDLIRQPIPLLKQGKSFKLHFTQQQVSCLLANAFFCTFPSDLNNFKLPEINFNQLFTRSTTRNHVKVEKLKCFLNYFKRVTNDPPTGVLTFERRSVDESKFPNWPESTRTLCGLEVLKDTRIEDHLGIQADFANKKIGGGVLRTGCVQEEIRFLANPELVVARLFSESLWPNEVIILTGSEQYNEFTGYAESFKYKSDFQDITELDEFKRRKCTIVAVDAINYSRNTSLQYEEAYLRRDCNKAYCGFVTERRLNDLVEPPSTDLLKMISGSWGCGAYKGERYYKAIIQLIAASESDRDLVYVSFEDDGFKGQLEAFYQHLISKQYTVGRVYKLLATYGPYKSEHPDRNFFDFVYESSD